jgi:hypothetical protein
MRGFMTFVCMFFIIIILLWLYNIYNTSTIIEGEIDEDEPSYLKKIKDIKVEKHTNKVLKHESEMLEKYLTENTKTNIVAYYMKCQGLASEGLWKYGGEFYDKAVQFYSDQYDLWFNNQNNPEIVSECLRNIRKWNETAF